MLFDTFENKYTLKGILVAIDPIHIGASTKSSLDPVDVDSSVLKDSRGYPVIPGASVKGVVRSWFESVLRGAGVDVCDVLDDKGYCTHDHEKEISKCEDLKERAELAYKYSCEVCKLFGGREVAGKIQFKDCYFISEPSFEIRDSVGNDRDTGTDKTSVKHDFELISKDSEFSFSLTAENLDEKQKKYFDYIVGGLKSGRLFKDCYLIGEPSFELRDGVRIDRETGAAKTGGKYDFEIISKDSEFSFYLTAENLDEKQKKYFDFIVEGLKSGDLSVGGFTTRGFGRFMVKDIEIEAVTKDDIKKRLGL